MKTVEEGPGGDATVRERLLMAAIDLFARKGYAATTVREIVDAVGVTKPVLYYYFGNKEGLYLELLRQALAETEAAWERALAGDATNTEKLLRLFDEMYALMLEHLDVVRLMHAIYYGPPQGAPFFDFDVFHNRFNDVIRRLILGGLESGEFKRGNVDDMTLALAGALEACTELSLCHPDREVSRETLGRVVRIVLEGVLDKDKKERQ